MALSFIRSSLREFIWEKGIAWMSEILLNERSIFWMWIKFTIFSTANSCGTLSRSLQFKASVFIHERFIIERLIVLICGSSVFLSVIVTLKASRSYSPYSTDSSYWNCSSVEQRGFSKWCCLRVMDDLRVGLFYLKARFIGCYSLYIIEPSFYV